jgi:glycosyltransferase involved in cell wall biosynthesis
LPLEDDNSRLILPALLTVAALSNAKIIEVRYPDLHAECIDRGDLLRSLFSVAGASARSVGSAIRCRYELGCLLSAPRAHARMGDDRRALYVNANLWFGVKAGGSVGHVAGVVNALGKAGCEVRYATAGGRTMIDPNILAVALQAPGAFGFPPELNQYRFHHMVARQLKALKAPGFIYQRMSIGNYCGVTLSRQWGVPLVLEYNGSEAWVAKNWGRPLRYHGLALKAEDACLRHAHAVVTISEVLRDELIEKGVEPERIVFYPNCIDPEVFNPAKFSAADSLGLRRSLGIAPNAILATFVGSFGQWHGVEILAQAIRRLVQEDRAWLCQTNAHFLLVGDGVKMAIVREIVSGAECAPFVTLAGLVPQAKAPAYLAASDLLLSPHIANADGSRFFGSPTKLFEYMAMGKAIVASDLDQIGQVLRKSLHASALPTARPDSNEERMAILFEPGNIPGLVESVKFAVDRPDWREALGRNGRAEVLEKYTWSHHVSAILDQLATVDR